jgi:poly(A) polymerase
MTKKKKQTEFYRCDSVFTPSQLSALKVVGEASEQLNAKCKLVGGAVRDCLLGKGNKDLDFVCRKPYQVAEKIADYVEETMDRRPKVPVFRKFGTAQVVYRDENGNREELEFVLPRKETYSPDSIKPQVDTGGTFRDDAFRRDFTLNALYLGVEKNEWMQVDDITGRGLDDLRDGILKTPRDPDITFRDDPSRLLRLARFASCKGFDIDDETFESARKNSDEIHRVPKEMVMQSMKRGIVCDGYTDVADDLNILPELIPQIENIRHLKQPRQHHRYDVWTHTKKLMDYLPPEYRLKFSGLFHDIGKGKAHREQGNFHDHEEYSEEIAHKWLRKYKFSNTDIDEITYIVKNHMAPLYLINTPMTDKILRRFARKHNQEGKDYTDELLVFSRADANASGVHHISDIEKINKAEKRLYETQRQMNIGEGKKFELAVDGHDVMRILDIAPSKRVGEVLDELERLVIDQELPNDENALEDYILEQL